MKTAPVNALITSALITLGSSAFAQGIPVSGGSIDIWHIAVAQRCSEAGVQNDEVAMIACVNDAESRAASDKTQHPDYPTELGSITVQRPVVVKDTRQYADELGKQRFVVAGELVMRAGATCAFQRYTSNAQQQASTMIVKLPDITTQEGSFMCNPDGSAIASTN